MIISIIGGGYIAFANRTLIGTSKRSKGELIVRPRNVPYHPGIQIEVFGGFVT